MKSTKVNALLVSVSLVATLALPLWAENTLKAQEALGASAEAIPPKTSIISEAQLNELEQKLLNPDPAMLEGFLSRFAPEVQQQYKALPVEKQKYFLPFIMMASRLTFKAVSEVESDFRSTLTQLTKPVEKMNLSWSPWPAFMGMIVSTIGVITSVWNFSTLQASLEKKVVLGTSVGGLLFSGWELWQAKSVAPAVAKIEDTLTKTRKAANTLKFDYTNKISPMLNSLLAEKIELTLPAEVLSMLTNESLENIQARLQEMKQMLLKAPNQ